MSSPLLSSSSSTVWSVKTALASTASFFFGTKTRAAFFTTVGVTSGFLYRDSLLSRRVREELVARARPLADEALPTDQMPRKIVVYITSPPGDGIHKSRYYFKAYLKPIWDAAAIDYELREGAKAGDIQRHVRNNFRRERRRPHVPPVERLAGLPLRQEGLPDGIVAIGRLAFVETVNGISTGSFGPVYDHDLPKKAEGPTLEAIKVEEKGTDGGDNNAETKKEQRKKSKAEIEEEEAWNEGQRIPPATLQFIESSPSPPRIPPVGFIPQRNIIGWARLPERILSWFTDYKQVRSIGERALAIAEDHRKQAAEIMAWEQLGEDEESEVTRWGMESRKLECVSRVVDELEIFL